MALSSSDVSQFSNAKKASPFYSSAGGGPSVIRLKLRLLVRSMIF
jgi:hypothetical protein